MSQPDSRRAGWGLLLLAATTIGILQAQPEISSAIEEGGIDYTIYLGPVWVKLVKDVFVVALWMYLVLRLRDPFPSGVRRAVAGCYVLTAICFVVSAWVMGPLIALSGLRWIIAVFVFLELRRLYGSRPGMRGTGTVLLILLIVNLWLQLVRLAYFPPVWGETWGLPARVPGFFLLPNTNALFAMTCAALAIDLHGRRDRKAWLALGLAVISAVISQSVGGLLAGAVLMLYMLIGRVGRLLPVALLTTVLLLSVAADWLGREGFLEYSGGERIDKLATAASEVVGIGAFGAYTNTGFMLVMSEAVAGEAQRQPVISDSFYVSVLGNFGFLALPIVYLFTRALFRCHRAVRRTGGSLGTASLLCLGMFGFSTVVSEVFPMALMLSIGVWAVPLARERRRAAPKAARPALHATPGAWA